MWEELDAHYSRTILETLFLAPLISSLWLQMVHSIKPKTNGSLEGYKAHLLALGNQQEYGIAYNEIFAPSAKMTTVHVLLALAAS